VRAAGNSNAVGQAGKPATTGPNPCSGLISLRPVKETIRDREDLLSVSMTVATAGEIKLLFLEFQSAGVTFRQKLKKQPWGAKNFVVQDPDGNMLLFAGPAE